MTSSFSLVPRRSRRARFGFLQCPFVSVVAAHLTSPLPDNSLRLHLVETGAALHAEPRLDLPVLELPGGAQAWADGTGERGVPGGRLMGSLV